MLKAEVENYVQNLQEFPVEEFASPKWLEQMIKIEKLNVEAHKQVSSNQFEQVVDYIKTFDKFEVLVHELLSSDLCLKYVIPEIKDKIPPMGMARHFIVERSMFTILNLIELIVFKPASLSSDGLMPLIDFCSLKLAQLVNMDINNINPDDQNDPNKTKFAIAFSCLSIIWCLAATTSDEEFPISVTKRMVNDDDLVPTLSELIVKQPWRTVKKGKVVKWDDATQGLKTLSAAESMRVCKPEAHAWTALQQFLEPRCLELTKWNEARREALLHVEGMLSEVLIDQLPPLQGLQRALQYLRVNQFPPEKFSAVIEQIPRMTEEFSKKFDWKQIARNVLDKYYNMPQDKLQKEIMMISDFLEIFG